MTLDREMADAYLTALYTVSPEDADKMEAWYENLPAGDEDDWAAMMIELLEENGLTV